MLSIVHRTFEIEGVYLVHPLGQPVRALCRLHLKPVVDRITFGDFNDAAEAWVAENTLVFDLSQIPNPKPDALFIVSRTEAYTLAAAKPPQDNYQYVAVTPMQQLLLDRLLSGVDATDPAWEGVL